MSAQLIIPMIVLARHFKTPLQVPAINPNYKTALRSYLGKDATPGAFNKNILLKKGIHLHFVLPSALKNGYETEDNNGRKRLEYPAVPDRFIVTRMYWRNGEICTDCNIVESNFYSLDSTYSDSITIPKFDDLRQRHRFRYMGRNYPASSPVPECVGECGYFDKITAVGAGDPMFSAYYPSCFSVFGFYDALEGVPSDAVLTYFVLGYYSDSKNDILNDVKTIDDMKAMLEKYHLSVPDENISVCNSSILFGEIGGIDLTKEEPVPAGEIDVGIGKTSAEALSAVISQRFYGSDSSMERFLTSIQYDTADESAQPDGNFKIDDDIHYRGFSRMDAMEDISSLKLPKDFKTDSEIKLKKQYLELDALERGLGKLRRTLEYKKKSLYYLWEIYEGAALKKQGEIMEHIAPLVKDISMLREKILRALKDRESKRNVLKKFLADQNGELEIVSSEPFYLPKDPALMLCGKGMERTYAFGEEGRFEKDHTLFCLTLPLTSDIPAETILGYFRNVSGIEDVWKNYREYLVTAVLLDEKNIRLHLNLNPVIKEKYSPVMYNGVPMEEVTLLMQWETAFYPNYQGAEPKESSLLYGNTDYVYCGTESEQEIRCSGVTVLTPHGVYNLQDKLEKYLEYHSDSPDAAQSAKKVKDLAAVSQSLGGFHISLSGLEHVFQYPIDIDPLDHTSKAIAECLEPTVQSFSEPAVERLAVCNDTQIFPLREGFFGITKLALVSSFGKQRKILDDELAFKGKRYISENLLPKNKELCFLPLALTSAARLSADFVTAADDGVRSSVLPGETPIIGIFLPDMLNRNINVFSNSGVSLGIVKTVYRYLGGQKTAVGRFVPSPGAPDEMEPRIKSFILALTKDNTAFAEVMDMIEQKLNQTLPLSENHFIFGRALVLAEISMELEFFGAPEWSKKDDDIGTFNDEGLAGQEFVVQFGDKNRETDGVCCGFYDGFSSGFPMFGGKHKSAQYLNSEPFTISSADGVKNVTLLFDPALKITVNTGFLPAKQIELFGEHGDFSKYQLLSSELHTMISEKNRAVLPPFAGKADFVRFYPRLENGQVTYECFNIQDSSISIGEIGETLITDGMLIERGDMDGRNKH
ncbi:Uncharacterised protein [uncultured Roseburia sp.]|uniref:Uncharacterized protein n=1 Tax=Brotonthovivens ammoniilytica TaxID=2981725 RepID=A0ABT2TI15_9FIRM|nr:hypothetical protein [Brotonthovivens ammoniilytica]MCU6761189.1 hypothetical protein [Brotonthovivens ammoniilytica]SCI21447.1 Uncharacterised protein [uncultured Roseburia sp.]